MNMNLKIAIPAACILAGAAAVYFLPKTPRSPAEPVASEEIVAAPETSTPASAPEPPPSSPPPPLHREVTPRPPVPKATPAPKSAWSVLAEKYGTEKTTLSSKITSNLTGVISGGIELAKTAALNSGSGSIAEAASKEALRSAATQLGLTEEQQQQASPILQSAVERRMAAITDLTAAMSSEPEQIMEMLLAGDALARKEISQEDYNRITQPTRTMLQNLAGFVAGQTGAGGVGQFLGDESTTAQLNAMLTPEQQTKLAEMAATLAQRLQSRQSPRSNAGTPFQGGQFPVMELERLDQSITAVRQMAEAARVMMEAMKGLKEANTSSPSR